MTSTNDKSMLQVGSTSGFIDYIHSIGGGTRKRLQILVGFKHGDALSRLYLESRLILTNFLRPVEKWKIARLLKGQNPTVLHLGSGGVEHKGELNVDIYGTTSDLKLDLRQPLPFPENSIAHIYHEHLLEHLSLSDGFNLTKECFRVLRSGGVMRVGVPNAGGYIDSYRKRGNTYLRSYRPKAPTDLIAIMEVFYFYGHRAAYDFETLALLCKSAGFQDVEEREWGDSSYRPDEDSLKRRSGTLYVEARKPLD